MTMATRWAPSSYKLSHSSIYRGEKTPVTHVFSAIYRGELTPLVTGSGAHLVGFFNKLLLCLKNYPPDVLSLDNVML